MPLVQAGQLVCRGCFAPFALMRPAHAGSENDLDATDALPQVASDPAGAGAPDPVAYAAVPPGRTLLYAVRLGFSGGQSVMVEPGGRVRIGRDARVCPCVRFLAGHDGLSRLHATVGVESDGSAWITDEGSTNGTFVHGYRLAPHEPAALHPGDSVRLAGDLVMRVCD